VILLYLITNFLLLILVITYNAIKVILTRSIIIIVSTIIFFISPFILIRLITIELILAKEIYAYIFKTTLSSNRYYLQES
jgi:hypothetical protein